MVIKVIMKRLTGKRIKNVLMLQMQLSLRETADLLRKHGGKTGEELKAEGN